MKTSVAMCTYNGEHFINEQLNSILNQTHQIDEIIVCDDGSTDKTIEILNSYSETHPNIFKIFQNEKNLRSVKNFEKAIQLCTGDVIFLSDQDDKWVPEKVAEYLDYFAKNKHITVLASNGYCIDENSKIHEKYAIWDAPQFLKEKEIAFDYFQLICNISNIATGASMAIKKEILPKLFPFPIIPNFHHDEWIAIISSELNQFDFLDKKYFYYRTHVKQQVGGVFMKKSKKTMKALIDIFNNDTSKIAFHNYKKKVKKLIYSYYKNKSLSNHLGTKSNVFENNCERIIIDYNQLKKDLKKRYPIKYRFLELTDKILNKRQFNPNQP